MVNSPSRHKLVVALSRLSTFSKTREVKFLHYFPDVARGKSDEFCDLCGRALPVGKFDYSLRVRVHTETPYPTGPLYP